MNFRVSIQKQGAPVETREMSADSRFAIYETIQKEGGKVVALTEKRGLWIPSNLNVSFGSGIKRQKIITLAKNLSAMLNAGLALSRALAVAERQSNSKRLKAVVSQISVSVTKGSSFHEALGEHTNVFSALFIAMAKAGEESGGLADALAVVALQMERSEELSRKIKGAMIYPSIIVLAIVLVSIVMLIFVVPALSATFTKLHVQLPIATRILIGISDFVVHYTFVVIGGLVVLGVGGYLFARSRRGKALILHGALHLPAVGELIRETFAARVSRTLASLFASGVPVLQAISITDEVVGTPVFGMVLTEAAVRVKKGDPLSASFMEHPKLYPIMMSDMIAVGEETGKVAEMLKQVAEFYEADVSQKTKDLSTVIEPVLMLLIGAVVAVFAVAMIAPIYSLSSLV